MEVSMNEELRLVGEKTWIPDVLDPHESHGIYISVDSGEIVPQPTEDQSLYFLETFVPVWLTNDPGYQSAFQDRLRSLMEMREYTVDYISTPVITNTPDCPPAPGMCTMRVEAVVSEFDCVLPMSEEEDE